MALIKSAHDIEKMRIAGQLAWQTLNLMDQYMKPGITTEELDQICHDFIVNELKAIPAALNYPGHHRPFPKSVCISVNHQVCHGIPGPKKLKDGDIVNVDAAIIKDGYYADTSKMYHVGKPSILAKRLVDITQECMYLAIKAVKPGTRLGDIGAIIQQHAEKNGFTIVREYCGHGLGTTFHEDPQILHYGKFGTGMELEPGMVFTIEPMVNAGKREVKLLPDDWTVVTKDHSLSAQWEHTILVTETGYEVLTLRPEETI
jgi:methionyl aminopeptidase